MSDAIDSARRCFAQVYLDGIPVLLVHGHTTFLSFVCCVAAIDALAGYRYRSETRFADFVRAYFPPRYADHADNLYRFRCRVLHNFSPAHFSMMHAVPHLHLQPSRIGDTILSDESFFADMQTAAHRFFRAVDGSQDLQQVMLERLNDLERGGAIYVE